MKKISLIVFALFAFVFAAQAQEKAAKTPEQRAEGMTKKLTETLSLTETQIPKVKSIFLDCAQKTQAVKDKYSSETDKKVRHEEVKKIRMESDNSLKQVLTPAQYDTYVKTKESHKNHGKKSKTPEQKAEGMTKKWTETLSLTEAQIPKVKAVFLDYAQKKQALKEKYPSETDKKIRMEEAKKIKKQTDTSLKQIFTPSQYDTYLKTKEAKKAEKKNKGKGKK